MSGGSVTWLGHATVLIEMEGVRLITDPVLRRRVAHLVRQQDPPDPGPPVDLVLISHLHRDHADLPTLRGLAGDGAIVAPQGCGGPLRRLGREVIELEPGGDVRVGPVRVLAVPAVHEVQRTPFGDTTPAVGYVIAAHERVYFAGDTAPFPGMRELAPLDVALLPVWGWGPSLGPGHMDPEEAAEAAAMLRPEVAVPIHWGTYLPAVSGGDRAALLRDPPHRFAEHAARLAPETRVEVLRPGETYSWT